MLCCRFSSGRLQVLHLLIDIVFDDDVRVCDMFHDECISSRVRRRQSVVYLDVRFNDGRNMKYYASFQLKNNL